MKSLVASLVAAALLVGVVASQGAVTLLWWSW